LPTSISNSRFSLLLPSWPGTLFCPHRWIFFLVAYSPPHNFFSFFGFRRRRIFLFSLFLPQFKSHLFSSFVRLKMPLFLGDYIRFAIPTPPFFFLRGRFPPKNIWMFFQKGVRTPMFFFPCFLSPFFCPPSKETF